MQRRLCAALLLCAGLAGGAAAARTDLHWLTRLLAPLAADGRVHALSSGETAVLRSVVAATSLALILSGAFLSVVIRAILRSRRRVNVRLRALAPRRITAALAQLAAAHGRAYVILLLVLLLGGTAVRLAHLAQPIHDDEAGAYLNWSAEPLYVTFTKYGAPGNHVLHTALVALSTRVFGDDPWAVRLPALLAGILCLPATFLLVRRLCGPGPALLALALLSASHAAIEYSANARGYSLATLLGLWQTAAVLRALDKPRWSNWRAVILPTALALYTLPTMIYLTAALALYALIPRRHAQSPSSWSGWHAQAGDPGSPGSTRGHVPYESLLRRRAFVRPLISFSLAGALTAALYAPFILVSGAAALTHNEFYQPLALADWVAALPARIAQTLDLFSAGLGSPWLILILAAIGLVTSRRLRHSPLLLWLTLFITPLAIALVQRLVPFARTLLYLQPFVYALCGLGFCTLCEYSVQRLRHSCAISRRTLICACGAAILPLLSAFAHRSAGLVAPNDFPDAKAVSQYLARCWPDDVPVFVVNPAVRPLLYHLRRIAPGMHPLHEQPPAADLALWVRSAGAQPTPTYREDLDRLCAEFDVGPTLRRFGAAEVVLLRSRVAGPTPQLIARTDHPEDRP